MSRSFGSNFGRQVGSVAAGADSTVTAGEASQVRRFKQLLLDEVDLQELALLDNDQRKLRLERILTHLISREGIILANRERTALVTTVINEAVGLGVLEPLLGDESVSEVMINGHDTVYIERFGKVEQISSGFTSEAQLLQTIDRIVSTVNRRVDESSPMVDARLPADERLPRGARVNVILPPLALNGPTVTIRLFPKAYGMSELLNRGTLDRPTADLLASCVRARLNIIVSGGTASGKTTMLNALSAFIPERERIVTIEDAAELSLSQEHVVRLETRPPNVDGKGQVTIRDLVRNSLRMRPDRIIVGEVRGGEALDMLQAMNTGHEGSLATVHANTADDALSRLETLATMSDVEVPFSALRDQVNSAVDIVVQLTRSADGQRRITEVAQVVSRRREDFILRPIMAWDDLSEEHGFVRYQLSDTLHTRLKSRGEQAPVEFASAPEPPVG
ncbi:CpaF family protein [Ornithinimicrobium humiphilum]|uniref:Pilus assembly protein CpaF n=1 Tax=Ornithinimicrobium humiphilum TaxID=125288 RepID=A0A543KL63_9MICO|nr:CpaF family protein [Ornithinimicrobium humiphilum]TQM95801.1 pilus assembly protein CpaF [Ornithinimicrobium humiphilum]